jgi:hypothetical protein
MSLGQHIFASFLDHLWGFVKEERERRRVSRMTPEQLEEWSTEEGSKLHKKAMKLAGFMNEKQLRKRGLQRADLVLSYEVLLRNNLGERMSQYLLNGMDIRGLDLRSVRGLNQQQIDRAVGDASTQLPDYLRVPRAWKEPKQRPATL